MTFMMMSSNDDKSDICQFSFFLARLIPYCQYIICTKFYVKWTKIFCDTAQHVFSLQAFKKNLKNI